MSSSTSSITRPSACTTSGPGTTTLRRGPLSLSDRLLATVIRNRWTTQVRALTSLLGSPREAVGDAVHEVTPLLEGLSHPIKPAPITAATAQDLAKLIGQNATKTISNWATAPCTGTRVGSAVRAQVFSGLSYFGGRSRASAASAGTNGSPQPDSWMPPRRNPCPDEGPERGTGLVPPAPTALLGQGLTRHPFLAHPRRHPQPMVASLDGHRSTLRAPGPDRCGHHRTRH